MTLYNIDDDLMDYIPHAADFRRWRSNLSDADYNAAVAAINDYIDGCGGDFRSSFIPGRVWTGTPYQPLYVACNQSWDQARFFFGIIVWIAVMGRSDEWYFRPADGEDAIQGKWYWLKK